MLQRWTSKSVNWSKCLKKDRQRYAGKQVKRTRRIELWSIQSGLQESCAKGKVELTPEVQEVLSWECIKWKIFSGRVYLSDEELALFKKRYLKLCQNDKNDVVDFIKKHLAVSDQMVTGIKSVDYKDSPLYKFVMNNS